MESSVIFVVVLAASLLGVAEGTSALKSTRAANEFPEGFYFGASSSSYQIEGAWDEDGKGESIWDYLLHQQPNIAADGENGDVAADSYHKYKEDVQALVNLNANVYRFSLSWPRILPTGDTDNINQAGIDYYNDLINELLDNGIQPMITLFHWDLPQELQKLGGWPNIALVDYFVQYARIAFENFGDRVKLWLTLNEPNMFSLGYSTATSAAPGANSSGVADYLLARTALLSHARTYQLYDQVFRATQGGQVGITLDSQWYEPLTNSTDDAAAVDRQLQFEFGMWAHPIFSSSGDYPEVVKQRVAANSQAEGRTRSRLPALSQEEIDLTRGSADFMGLNHYSTMMVTSGVSGARPSKEYDAGTVKSYMEGYPISSGMADVPWGFRKVLNYLHSTYPGYSIFITENGWGDTPGTLNDTGRIDYYKGHLAALVQAINEDGVPVMGYSAWSLLDAFEWMSGYTVGFGLHYVDFDDPERPRRPKASVSWLSRVYKDKAVPVEDMGHAKWTPAVLPIASAGPQGQRRPALK